MIKRNPIFLNPIFKDRIWGGTTLKDKFGYDIFQRIQQANAGQFQLILMDKV